MMIIVPAYNEADNIGRVVRGLFEHRLRGFSEGITQIMSETGEKSDWRVVVVDDGSTDQTAEIARAEGAQVIRHEINRGQGAALETGNEYARRQSEQLVAHFDGDGQFNPADIPGAIKLLKENNLDAVIGSRFLDKRSRLPWSKRHIILPISRLINYLFTGVYLTDAHNGFRVLGPRALLAIKLTHDGMAHNTEIIRQLKKAGLKFAEYPVEVTYREYGQGVKEGLKIFKDLIFSRLAQ